MDLKNLFFIFLIFITLYGFLKKKELLIDKISYSAHKNIGAENKSPVIIGGLFILIVYLFFYDSHSLTLIVSSILITLLGLMSDKNILTSPKKRLIFQFLILLFLTYFENLQINDVKFEIFNIFLSNKYFNLFFTTFCLAILINGSNFLDGLNGLLAGYYLIILISVIFLINSYPEIDIIDYNLVTNLIFVLFIFFVFNIFGLVYLGDSGTYLLSLLIGIYLIKFNYNNELLSPYYIAVLLWYPAFENFFSLIRRSLKKQKTSSPDNLHLHHMVFIYLRNKKIFSKKILNPICSFFILVINLPGFLLALNFPTKSFVLLSIILFNILFYIILYYFFSKNFIKE